MNGDICKNRCIALFIRDLDKGGAQYQSILLAQHLSNYYKTYLLVYYQRGEFIRYAQEQGLQIIFLHGSHLSKIYSLYKFLKREKIYLLINYLNLNNILGILVGRFAGVSKLFGGIRTDNLQNNSKVFRIKLYIQKVICNLISDGFISNSYAAQKSFSEYGFKKDKIIVIHNMIHDFHDTQKDEITGDSGKISILSVGRFIKQKRYDIAIEAIRHLIEIRPEILCKIKYNIVGYGALESEIRNIVEKYDLGDVIQIRDGRNDIYSWYKTADIFLLSSMYEGTPNAMLDAMIYKLPIVATDVGDIKYFIKNKYNGFLHPVDDVVGIASSLKYLLDNSEKRKNMGENGYNYIIKNYSEKKIIKKYLELID